MKVTFTYLAMRIFRIRSAMSLLEFVEMLESHIVGNSRPIESRVSRRTNETC